jgi:uncharacterized protein (TIGR02099 family)
MTNIPPLFRTGPRRGWLLRLFLVCILLAGFGMVTLLLALRYWFLPNIESYRDAIAEAASRAAGQRITIGKIIADWEGLRPHLSLEDVQVFDQAGRPALVLSRVATTLSWLTLPTGEVRLRSLEFEQPNLSIRRDSQGVIYVAGVPLSQREAGTGFVDWLLKQERLVIRDATILWQDEKLAAPQLVLNSVTLRMDNKGNRHHFSLDATPPAILAAPLEVKGDFTGDSLDQDDLHKWRGTISAQLDYADIAAWRTWLPYPIEVQKGSGALRIWLTLSDAQIQEAAADVVLSQVKTRLRPDLPEMNLTELRGRIGWKTLSSGFELSGVKLSLAAQGGIALQPADFTLRIYPGSDQEPMRGEIKADAFDLQPLVVLADYLPLGQALRQQLLNFSPKGSVYDMALQWSGDLPMPGHYSVKGRFVNLALNAHEEWPGFRGISGAIEGNEQGGQITLDTKDASVALPRVFEHTLKFDSLNARLGWTLKNGQTKFSLNQALFSNSDLSGNVQGHYLTVSRGPGVIDLTGSLTHVEARSLNRYLPLIVNKDARDWLANASVSGAFSDVRLRFKGDLADFPFADEAKGLLQFTAKANGMALDYFHDWPKLENITADLQFRGRRMEIHAGQARILGAKLAKIDAVIPELGNHDEVLQIEGEAEAPAEEFLRFIEHSPISRMTSGVADGMHAEGAAKLELKLNIPLRRRSETKVAGIFHFNDNHLSFNTDLPSIEQLKGRLQFSESTLQAQNLSAQILGGPARIEIATQDGNVQISAQGKANADAAEKFISWAQYLHGTAEWRGSINISKKLTDMVLESNLQGLTSQLPAPFDKAASASVPLRFETRIPAARPERVLLNYGNVMSMHLVRRKDGERSFIERGVVVFGADAGRPDKSGVWLSGSVKNFDFDQWNALLSEFDSTGHIDLAGIDLKFDTLDAFDRRFHDLHVNARAQGGSWQTMLDGSEIDGELIWQPQNKGKLIARLSKLTIPEAVPEKSEQRTQKSQQKDFPALDVSADNFVLGDKALGKLELQAVQQGRNWHIQNLRLSNPDSVLNLDGMWLAWSTQPQTQANLNLEVTDIGNLMGRLKLPEGVKRGNAKLVGALSWAGSPQHIDYATLSGNLQLKAEKGQFTKLEPGIAKLLGILSLQSLPRRASLDFRDIFSEGFAFDSITSTLNINQGVITTENLRMRGPSAEVNMSGQVNLAQETQQLKVHVAPNLVDSLSLAGFIGGPIIGVTAFLVQKALKDPLGQFMSYEYNVTGTWSEPVVAKLGTPLPAQEMQLWQNP